MSFEFYAALGLDPKLILDADDLRKRFYVRSRESHPDLAGASAEDRMALLNDAFRTLRNPVSRAEYFLHQSGLELAKDVPPELLEEVFDLNMALEEIRGGDESALPQLESARKRFAGMQGDIDAELAAIGARYDGAPNPAALEELRGALNRRRYISNLLRDVDKELTAKN